MTKTIVKEKTELMRVLRASLRDWSALFDSLRAIKDPESIRVIAEQLQCQQKHISETVALLGDVTTKVCAALGQQ